MSEVGLVGFSCTACGKQYRWKPELAGKTVRCKCGNPVSVPKAGGGGGAARGGAAAAGAQARAAANAPGIAAATRSADVPTRPVPKTAAAKPPAATRMPPPPPPPAPAPARREQYQDPFGDQSDDGGIDALAALAQQEAAAGADATASADSHFCANCRNRMSPGDVLCTNCGFDRRRGAVLAAPKVKTAGGGFLG